MNVSVGSWGLWLILLLGVVVVVFSATLVRVVGSNAAMAEMAPRDAVDLYNQVRELQAQVEELRRFKADCDVAVPSLAKSVETLGKANLEWASEVNRCLSSQELEAEVLQKALSDSFGKERWAALVVCAKSELEDEAKRAAGRPQPVLRGQSATNDGKWHNVSF